MTERLASYEEIYESDPVADVADVAHPAGESELSATLDAIEQIFCRYVAFPMPEHRWAVCAWIVHCWTLDAFESTPRLALLSAERGSGKTRALEVIEMFVPRPMHSVNMSAAALFRQIRDHRPTLLLDEADTYLGLRVAKDHEDLRGLVNAGHRRGAKAYRCTLEGGVKVEEYEAFAPVALAGIGDLPDTIIDRSIVVPMKRRAPGERVDAFRHRKAEKVCLPVREHLEQCAETWVDQMVDLEPELPAGIEDRPADVWEPIIVIGDTAGGVWRDRLRQAASSLVAARQERDPSLGVQLLSDCRAVFTGDRMTTDELLVALNGLEESPWGDLRGQPLDARGLARRLRKYEVRPRDHRFTEGVRKGYLRSDFHDAWTRYLPTDPSPPEIAQQPQPASVVTAETLL